MSYSGSINYLHFSPYQISSPNRTTLRLTPHWFLIRILTDILNLTIYGNSMNISFSSINMVTNGWFKMYLNIQQQIYLQNSGNFELYPIKNIQKKSLLALTSNQNYYVHASSDWQPPAGSQIISQITNTLYLVINLTITEEVANDHRIFTINRAPHKKLNNRYNSGFLQTHHQKSVYDHKIYGPIRSLHNIGLDGTGQVINIVDTGVDVYNALFYDSNHPLDSISGKTNINHRKIVRIEKYADDVDYLNGHGTHVSGIAAGNAYCQECGISQYNGIASGAKIYFSDVGYADVYGDMSEDFDLQEQANLMNEVDSYISSNSWGYDYPSKEDSFIYDQVAYNNPNILYLFAAGNDYVHFSINSPGCAKNVVSVGATDSISSSNAEINVYSVVIENETVSVNCNEKSYKLIRSLGLSEKMTYIVNRSIVGFDMSNKFLSQKFSIKSDELNFKDSIVLLNFDNDDSDSSEKCNVYSSVVSAGASAVVYRSSVNLKCSSFSIPTITVSDDQFKLISEMKTASIFPFAGSDDVDLPSIAALSSKGPSDSSLSKPDFAVPGYKVTSAKSHGTRPDYHVSSDFNSNFLQMSGTSMATPAASALAIIVRQFFRDGFYPNLKKNSGTQITPSSCLMRAMLVNSAVKSLKNSDEENSGPSFDVGFGIPCLETVFGFRGSGLRIVDNVEMKSKTHHIYHIFLDNNLNDLRVTMTYLDPPLNVDNDAHFFADLDLVIKSPTNKFFVGNGVTKLADSDSFSNTERVIVNKEDIPTNGGDFEIHVISSDYPIDNQKVTYSIVVNGPFNQDVSEKNPVFLQHKDATKNDCVNDCSGNGICNNKGFCECNEKSIGISCNTKITTINDGETKNDTYVHKKINYFKISPKDQSANFDLVNFSIDKSSYAANVFLCISNDQNPGKITNAAWQCFLSTKENYSFELTNDDFNSLFLAIYISYFNPVDVILSNIKFSQKEKQIDPNQKKSNKKMFLIIGLVVGGIVFIALLAGLIVLIVKLKKKRQIGDDIKENIIQNDGSNETVDPI